LHVKGTDMAGEDGDFAAKVAVIEAFDAALPRLLALKPDVLAVTGDHSTPVPVKGHSWHPVPALVSSGVCFADGSPRFHEKACRAGFARHAAQQGSHRGAARRRRPPATSAEPE
jgi:2,3-bisphosphoglycerate-independent phosphoglycerate mutase